MLSEFKFTNPYFVFLYASYLTERWFKVPVVSKAASFIHLISIATILLELFLLINFIIDIY
jgi:hypothetical protein